MDYYNLAIKRESTRSFKKRPISSRQLTELQNYIPSCRRMIPELAADVTILGADAPAELKGCAGYHGLMIEAPNYLVISSAPHDHAVENAGYMGEDLVMKLTELELESCWITIQDPEEMARRLHLPDDRRPMALIAFGNATVMLPSSRLDIKSVSNIFIKQRTGFIAPKLAVDHAVYTKHWGESAEISSLPLNNSVYQAFIAACCAPSYLNLQPYRFILDKNTVLMVCLPDEMTTDDDIRLNVGIAMLHFAGTMENHHPSDTGWVMGAPEGSSYEIPEGAWIAGYYVIDID